MDSPNPELMHLYGTDTHYLEKIGAIPPGLASALQTMAGGASIAMAQDDANRRQKILIEAELMNRQLRAYQAYRMSDVVAGFGGDPNVSINAGLEDPAISAVKTSSVDSELFRFADETGRLLAKHAGMGVPGIVNKVVGAAKGLFGGGVPSKITGALAKGPAANPMADTLKKGVEAVGKGPVKKPLISTGTKLKAGLGAAGAAALAGTGYAGYKGLQATRDYMMTPSQQQGDWGGYGPQPMNKVNPYGVVQANY